MAIIYYPKSQFMYRKDTVSASFETLVLECSPNTILYFDTGSGLTGISSSIIEATCSYSITASYALSGYSGSGGGGGSLVTGSTYPITASWSVTASYAMNGGGSGGSLTTGSTYPITASWAKSASYYPGDGYYITNNIFTTVTNTAYTASDSDIGKFILFFSSSPITIYLPSYLSSNYIAIYFQSGSGALTITSDPSVTVLNRYNYTSTGGVGSVVNIYKLPNGIFVTSGDLQ
jgi:hypothetical protein